MAEVPDTLANRMGPREIIELSRLLAPQSGLFVPLVARGETVGALALVYSESGRHYSAADLALAADLGTRAGSAIDRARLYAAAQQMNSQIRSIFENLDVMFYSVDVGQARFTQVSPTCERLYGISQSEFLADSECWLRSLHPEDRPGVLAGIRDQLENGDSSSAAPVMEFRIRSRDGTERWIARRARPSADASGRIVRVDGFHIDITERKQLEAQFQQAQKMEAVGRLAGSIAHDFNNVLTAILGYADLAIGARPNDACRADIEEIQHAAGRAAALTKRLLSFSRRQVVQPRHARMADLLANAEKMLRPLIGEDIDLVIGRAPADGCINIDPTQFDQVLLNLAVNAKDAMQAGGRLSISATRESVENCSGSLQHLTPGEYVVLEVSDTGAGITPEVANQIFEPFFTTKPEGKGTGLGLSTVYGIVTQANGAITVESAPDAGTCFTLYFPRAQACSCEATSRAPKRFAAARAAGRILLVEDQDAVRKFARRALERSGFEVTAVDGVTEALDRAADSYDLIITDLIMADGDGRELVGRLRAHSPNLRALLMSGLSRDLVETQRFQLDKDTAFLEKPFTGPTLVERVRQLLA